MATDKHAEKPAQATDVKLPTPIAEPDDNFMPLASNRHIYKPETCGQYPVKGFLLTRLEMPPVGGEREWAGYVIRLTAPTVGVDREGKLQALEKGDEILIVETHVLASDKKIQVISKSPEWIAEIWLKPTKKMPIGGGQTLWLFDARMAPARKRNQEEKMYNLVEAIAPAGQLPAAANGQAAAAAPPF